jgi:hypothetical protein
MHPTGREDVENRQGEQDPPWEGREPSAPTPSGWRRASADDVVAMVDRLEERVEVGDRPFLEGRRHQDDRLGPAGQALFQRLVPSSGVGPDDEGLGLALSAFQEVEQPPADRVGVGVILGRHDDDQDVSVGDRVAAGGEVERVDPVVTRFRGLGLGEGPHARDARGASQSSRAAL